MLLVSIDLSGFPELVMEKSYRIQQIYKNLDIVKNRNENRNVFSTQPKKQARKINFKSRIVLLILPRNHAFSSTKHQLKKAAFLDYFRENI